MKRRGLLLLALVAAAMAAFIIVEARRRPERERGGTTHARALPPFDRSTVRNIAIRRQSGAGISLLPSPSPNAPAPAPRWHIEGEGEPAADDAAVDELLAAADLAESERTADIAPEAAGLAPAVAELDIETPRGTLALQLGRADPTGRGVYARAGNDAPVRVIGRRLMELVDRDPAAFRDRRLFPVEAAAITAIAWRGEDGAGQLRSVGGRWQNGRGEWVAGERVAESLRRLHALRIDKFLSAAPAATGRGRTLAVTAGATRIAIDARPNGELTRGAEQLHVPADAFEAAWRSLATAAARDDRLVAQPFDIITEVKLSDDRAHVNLRRVDGAWTFAGPKVGYAADTHVVDDWLARLAAIKVATRSAGPHARHLTVEGRFTEQVDVSSPPEVYAMLAPDPLRFRDREVLAFARFDVRRLQRTVGAETEEATTDDGASWHTTSPGRAIDDANVSRIIAILSELRADEFIAAPPAGRPAVQLVIDIQPPGAARPAPRTLRVYPRGDGCVARMDADVTFTVDRATCETLRLDLFKKTGSE